MDIQFRKLSDEEIVRLAQDGDQDATEYILKKYSPLVKKSIRTLYLIGADTEDLSQEGMIGLFKAVRNYESGENASFYTFAKLCIDRLIVQSKHLTVKNTLRLIPIFLSIPKETRKQS